MVPRTLLILVLAACLALAACSEAHGRGPRADAAEARDADVEDSSEVPDGPCAQRVDARGESPFGSLWVSEVEVYYWHGFTRGTSLVARAQAGAQAIEIRADVYTLKYDDEAAPVGEYRSASDESEPSDLLVRASLCADTRCGEMTTDLRRAQLRVDTHEIPEVVEADSPVRFEGTLRIFDPGWSLDLPFALRKACGSSVDL